MTDHRVVQSSAGPWLSGWGLGCLYGGVGKEVHHKKLACFLCARWVFRQCLLLLSPQFSAFIALNEHGTTPPPHITPPQLCHLRGEHSLDVRVDSLSLLPLTLGRKLHFKGHGLLRATGCQRQEAQVCLLEAPRSSHFLFQMTPPPPPPPGSHKP